MEYANETYETVVPDVRHQRVAVTSALSVHDILVQRYGRIIDRMPTDRSAIGTEQEFPLLTGDGRPLTRQDNIIGVLANALDLDILSQTATGEVTTVRSPDGKATIGYEYSRAILEISLAPAPDCITLLDYLTPLRTAISAVLAHHDITLGYVGVHPQAWSRTAPAVPTHHYNAVDLFMKAGATDAIYQSFTGFVASSQTHVDATARTAPHLLQMFRHAGFVQALVLANSRCTTPHGEFLLARDQMWSASAFGVLRASGTAAPANDMESLLQAEATHRLFLAHRDGTIWTFAPVSLATLDTHPEVEGVTMRAAGPERRILRLTPDDALFYRSYDIAAPTPYGTIEIRGDCQQPEGSLLAPAAFATGLSANITEALDYLRNAIGTNDPATLRAAAARSGWNMPTLGLTQPLNDICRTTLDIAKAGLAARGAGEERLLDPLYARATAQTNPAMGATF